LTFLCLSEEGEEGGEEDEAKKITGQILKTFN
jgi:hypothetical protein